MTTKTCLHRSVEVAGLRVTACVECSSVEWSGSSRPLDPAEGMAALFGEFDLIGRLPAVAAPGPEVLMYRAPTRRLQAHLRAFPGHMWFEVDTNLWLSHDGEHLLLVPTTPLLLDNMLRGA